MNTAYVDQPTKCDFANLAKTRRIDNELFVRVYTDAALCLTKVEGEDTSCEVLMKTNRILPNCNSNIIYDAISELSCDDYQYIDYQDKDIIYLGCFYNCWGHFFTDGLAKAWYLLTDEYKQKYKGKVKIAISFINNTLQSCPKPLLSLYQLLGVDEEDIIVITQPTRFRSMILPDNSLFFHDGTRHFTKDYTATIDAITNAVPANLDKKFEKIYLSRTHFTKGNADFGERSLESVFKRLGYTIIHPQEYSVLEQIAIFKAAKSFVSTTGSLGHNSVFCNRNTEVILLRKCWATFDYQLVINEAKELNVTYVDTHLTCFVNDAPNNGPFYLYRNANFCRFIKDRFNITVREDFSTKRYMRYMRICLMRNDMKNRTQAHEYYFNKLREELQNDSWKRKWFHKLSKILPPKLTKKITSVFLKSMR